MKQLCKNLLLTFTFIMGLSIIPSYSQGSVGTDIERPTAYISDYGNIMSSKAELDNLNTDISNYEKTSGMEIAVLTINTLGDNDLFDFSQTIFKKWGVGKSASNNGILIVIVKDDHKYRIHTGYGAEIVLPDLACDDLAQKFLVPNFRKGDYNEGLKQLVHGIMAKIGTNSEDIKSFQAAYKAKKEKQEAESKQAILNVFIVVGLLTLLGILIYFLVRKYKKDKAIKDRVSKAIYKANLSLIKLKSIIANSRNQVYTQKIKDDLDKLIIRVGEIPTTPIVDEMLIVKLKNYNTELENFIIKIKNFNAIYDKALRASDIVKESKDTLHKIDKLNDKLAQYNTGKKTSYTSDKLDKILELITLNINNDRLSNYLDELNSVVESIHRTYSELLNIDQNIPKMESDLNKRDETIKKLTKKLKDNGLDDDIKKVNKLKEKLDSKMNNYSILELFVIYELFTSITNLADTSIRDKENREREIKRRKDDEESAARRRRNSYSSSSSSYGYGSSDYGSSSSSSSSSSDSSSSFGGFGGGDSGGGGSSGSW